MPGRVCRLQMCAIWCRGGFAGCKCVQSDPREGLQEVLRQPVKVVPIAGEPCIHPDCLCICLDCNNKFHSCVFVCTCGRLELEAACQSRSHWWWTLNTTRLSLHLPRLQQHNITTVAMCVHVVCWNHCRQFAGVIIEQFVGPLLNRISSGVTMFILWNKNNLLETMVFLWNRTIIGIIMIFYVSSLMVLDSYDIWCYVCCPILLISICKDLMFFFVCYLILNTNVILEWGCL